MARKVFISFLGTSNYVETRYSFPNNEVSEPVRFIQEALIGKICSNWTENDQIYIFCTNDAEKLNWIDNGQPMPKEEADKIGLETRLKGLSMSVPFDKVPIKEGFSEEEIWDIFDTVYKKLKKEDEIYFDVTHAFRSIPLFSIVLFNYSRFMKETNVVSIQYGAFEKLGSAFEVRKKPLEERGFAPIIDLTNIARLQEYNEMASNLVNYGKTKKLSNNLQNSNETNNVLVDLCKSITDLDEFIATNQLSEIKNGKFIAKFRSNVKPVMKKQPHPIKEILGKIKSETQDFIAAKDNRNIEAAIMWAKDHEMLAQAYSLAEEYIVLRVTELFESLNPFGKDNRTKKQYREFISLILGLPEDAIQKKDFHGILYGHDNLVMELLNNPMLKSIRPEYEEIRKRRNSIIHGNGEYPYHNKAGNDLDTDFYPKYKACIDVINKYAEIR